MPSAVREQLARQLAPYRRSYPETRWTRPPTWHLTLTFLGSVEPARVPELQTLIDTVAAERRPLVVRVDRGGGREHRGDGVGWLAISTGAGTVIETADLVTARCPAGITSGGPPKRTPSAHLTVARKADRSVLTALETQAHGPLSVSWEVDRIELLRSHLERDGARYETLHLATL